MGGDTGQGKGQDAMGSLSQDQAEPAVGQLPSADSEATHRGDSIRHRQVARARLRFGDRFEADAEIGVTPAGLLAIGAMVSAMLLGSAAIVLAAARVRAAERGGGTDAPRKPS